MECPYNECPLNVLGVCGLSYDEEGLLTYEEAQEIFDECLNPDLQPIYLAIQTFLILEHFKELRRRHDSYLRPYANEKEIVSYMKKEMINETASYYLPGSQVLLALFRNSHTPISPSYFDYDI